MLRQLQLRVGIQNGCGIPIGAVNQAHVAQPFGELDGAQTALGGTQHIARATQSEIFFRYFKSIQCAAENFQLLPARFAGSGFGEQDAITLVLAAADTPTQLVQLREPEGIRIIDNHEVGIRYIHTDFHHCGGDENVELPLAERLHHLIFFRSWHAAMQQAHPPLREKLFPSVQFTGGTSLFAGIAILHQRGDDIDLPTGIHLLTHEGDNALHVVRIAESC